jgi:hypothetical protein
VLMSSKLAPFWKVPLQTFAGIVVAEVKSKSSKTGTLSEPKVGAKS